MMVAGFRGTLYRSLRVFILSPSTLRAPRMRNVRTTEFRYGRENTPRVVPTLLLVPRDPRRDKRRPIYEQ